MLTQEEKDDILILKDKYSVYAVWSHRRLLRRVIEELVVPFKNLHVDKVVGIEGRGFILAAPVAYNLNAGFVPIRKAGNMYTHYHKNDVLWEKCDQDYSGKGKILEIEKHEKSIQKGDRVLLIDDWFEKGAQGRAAIRLIERLGGTIVGIGVMLDEMTDEVRVQFSHYNLHTLVQFTSQKSSS